MGNHRHEGVRAINPDRVIRVGIAEDHPLARRGLVQLLETTDDIVVVGEVDDGEGALRLASDAGPDVIVIDLRMPDVDGIEVTRRLAEDNPGVAVIILTAHDDAKSLAEAVQAGAKAYVLKTADADEVLETVRLVGRGHAVLDARAWMAVARGEGGSRPATDRLTPRELEVLRLLAKGLTNRQIASELGVSMETIKTHVERICHRVGASDRTGAVAIALRAGVIE